MENHAQIPMPVPMSVLVPLSLLRSHKRARTLPHPSPTTLRPLIPPQLATPQLDEPPRAQDVAPAQQGGGVDVERRVDLGMRQQARADGADGLEDRVCRGPGVGEQVETDVARGEVDVRVDYRGEEADLGRGVGVGRREGDGEEPAAFCLWRGGKWLVGLLWSKHVRGWNGGMGRRKGDVGRCR